MNNEVEFKERLGKIRENTIIAIDEWWGHKYPGYKGIIVTNNKEVYKYQYYHIIPEELKRTNSNYIVKIKDLDDNEYQKIIMFIENEIANKQFVDQMIFDAGFDILINYNGINKKIKNNKGFGNNFEIYDKAEMLLKELLK